MGVFTVPIQVGSPDASRFETLEALVDSGSSNTCIPASALQRLGVKPYRRASFELADGRVVDLDMGRTWIKVNGDQELTQVVFAEEGTEALLGMITLEELGLGIDSVRQVLVPVKRMRK